MRDVLRETGRRMRKREWWSGGGPVEVPWWGTAAAVGAPVLLLAGLAAAGRSQPPGADPVANPVSALAEPGAADRWIMTATFVVVAACDILVALALKPAARAGRTVLVAAGLAGMMVAVFPEHLGGSVIHACWAGAGFGGLVLWPALARRGGPGAPWGLRPVTSLAVTALLAALTAWYLVEQVRHGPQLGVSERAAGIAQTAWPLVVVLSCRRARLPSLITVTSVEGETDYGPG